MAVINNAVPELKARTIKIIKEEVYKDVNALSYKYAEAIAPEMKRVGDAFNAASDTADKLDLRIIQRGLEYRDAKLRELLDFALEEEEIILVDNTVDTESTELIYNLKVDALIDDKMLKPLAITMNRYLYSGVLYDWYSKSMGMKQAQVYEAELMDIENSMVSVLRSSRVRRPLQPKI